MARALRDAGFQDVEVFLDFVSADGVVYQIDNVLVDWQQHAINGDGMIPITMQLDFEHRSVEFLKKLP